jgi:hypothetical protein
VNNAVEQPWDRVPTPVPGAELLIVGGGGPQGLLMAMHSGAAGEVPGAPGDAGVAWRVDGAAPYLPTPLVYRGLVYAMADNGVLTVYREADGTRLYRARLADDAGTISASPVAADGRIYVGSQDGDVFVVGAGESFELLARNRMHEPIFATPAIAGDTLLVRTASALYGIGKDARRVAAVPDPRAPMPGFLRSASSRHQRGRSMVFSTYRPISNPWRAPAS